MTLEEKILGLLVASGNVTEEKVEEARMLALSLKWDDGGLTKGTVDLPRACALGNHWTTDEGGRPFDFCPDCGKPLT